MSLGIATIDGVRKVAMYDGKPWPGHLPGWWGMSFSYLYSDDVCGLFGGAENAKVIWCCPPVGFESAMWIDCFGMDIVPEYYAGIVDSACDEEWTVWSVVDFSDLYGPYATKGALLSALPTKGSLSITCCGETFTTSGQCSDTVEYGHDDYCP